MRNIKILDCTLRDGGCVNGFNFGSFYMNQILHGIEQSGVEIIELGYIDSKAGSEKERTQYCSDKVITENFLTEKKPGITYVAMTDYGKYDPELLEPRSEKSIDGIRLAFHKKNRKDILLWGRKILDKGYKLFIQPMTCLRYTDMEMLDLINDVNTFLPETSAFYIVDSFGEMRLNDMNRLANLINHNLNSNIAIGLHSHNNLQLSYSNAVTLLNFPTERDMIFDASIMGMGKGAGNMTTELFAEHLNLYEGKSYKIAPLLEVVDKAINQIRENYPWGYAVEYYLSAANHCTPSYSAHFYKKHMLSVDQVAELLGMIKEEKKISFDREYADELYYEYNAKNFVDQHSIEKIRESVSGKRVLLVAPGASVTESLNEIREFSDQEDVVTISLNNIPPFPTDYIFVSKQSVMDYAENSDSKRIITSNVTTDNEKGLIINYTSWTNWSGGKSDNALFVMMNILKFVGAKKIVLAGFDGFMADVDKNYYDEKLKRPVNKEQADRRNSRTKAYLNNDCKDVEISFLTASIYQ
ncbi:MAG: aldolase catalytic domain-containing protein [Acutalibacteraceae bacterium]